MQRDERAQHPETELDLQIEKSVLAYCGQAGLFAPWRACLVCAVKEQRGTLVAMAHTLTDQLPVSSSQTNSNSYIPTSALIYYMQQITC